jgi:acetoin utilization protein AcuC
MTTNIPAIIYHELYNGRGFSRLERSWGRYQAGLLKLRELGLLALDYDPSAGQDSLQPGYLPVYRPTEATIEQLATVHSMPHINHVIEMDKAGKGMFDRGDTPAWPGVYRRAAMAVGGTLLAADLVGSGQTQHAFHPAGGLHHAHYERVSGFCIFNDIVAAVRLWQTRYGYKRIAILDIDGHHGDGTQSLLYREPILTVSLHMYDGRFFPRTGAITERGEGEGLGYALNLPLPRFTTDAEYLEAFEIAINAVEAYAPDAILLQFGVDGHYSDRMVGLKLSTYVYEYIAAQTHSLAHRLCQGRLVVVGGGGYEPETVARCWAILAANLANQTTNLGQRYTALHDLPSEFPPSNPAAVLQFHQMVAQL